MNKNDSPTFGFALEYGGELIYCEVVMCDTGYDIYFNNVWTASIAHTEDFTWIQSSGVILPQNIIDEIGLKAESWHK